MTPDPTPKPTDPDKDHRQTMFMLCAGTFFFAAVVIAVAFVFPANQGIYALFSGLLGAFSSALFVKIRA